MRQLAFSAPQDESGNAVPSREYFQGMMYLLQTDGEMRSCSTATPPRIKLPSSSCEGATSPHNPPADPGMMFVRAAVLRCLIALVRNASIDPDLLDCSRMLPQR